MAKIETYKRGQVEWALWQFADLQQGPLMQLPKVFQTRIKRLLDLDREGHKEGTGFAFAETLPGGQGADMPFTAFDAFCLALALDLLDMGFKQSEVVFLLRHLRTRLVGEYRWIMSNPLDPRQSMWAEDAPERPSYEEHGQRVADFRVFAVIQKVELTETMPTVARTKTGRSPVILQPVFCRGIEALQKELHEMGHEYRKAVVLEMAHAAVLVSQYLEQAPVTRRGRR